MWLIKNDELSAHFIALIITLWLIRVVLNFCTHNTPNRTNSFLGDRLTVQVLPGRGNSDSPARSPAHPAGNQLANITGSAGVAVPVRLIHAPQYEYSPVRSLSH